MSVFGKGFGRGIVELLLIERLERRVIRASKRVEERMNESISKNGGWKKSEFEEDSHPRSIHRQSKGQAQGGGKEGYQFVNCLFGWGPEGEAIAENGIYFAK